MPLDISAADLTQVLAAPNRIVLLDLYDNSCTACLTQDHFIDTAALDLRYQLDVYRMNLAQAPDFASRYGIRSLPTVALFKNGRLHQAFPGLTDPGSLAAAVEALAKA